MCFQSATLNNSVLEVTLTSSSHGHHGLRVICSFQAEAFDGGQSGDDRVGLVWRAGPVVSVDFKTCGTRAGVQATGPWQTQLLASPNVVTASVGCPRDG